MVTRMVFFPGANEKLITALGKLFAKAKLPAEEFSATTGGLTYSGPVVQHSATNFHWSVNATALATKAKQSAPPKKKAPAKKAAKAKPAPKKAAKKK